MPRQATAMAERFAAGVVTPVHQGDCLVSGRQDLMFSTVLGSCISACIRDRQARIGGMNHFLLAGPTNSAGGRFGQTARYGAFAMEQLINMVLTQGTGRRENLEFKVFGGGNIHPGMDDIGLKNIAFVLEFLSDEGYPVFSQDLGGTFARRLMFQPYSGRAFIKRLDSTGNARLMREELAIASRQVKPPAAEIELF